MDKQKLFSQPYEDLPSDPKQLLESSNMKDYPEVTLEQYLSEDSAQQWEQYAIDTGADLDSEYDPKMLTRLDVNESDFVKFMTDNMKTCEKKYYERTYQRGKSELTMNLPMKCGYNHRNTIEYNWGEYGDSQEKLKQLMGGEEIISGRLGFEYETARVRLLAYLPGQIFPWHFDNMGLWLKRNQNLNPNLDTMTCDRGKIKRYFVAISDWHWGHVLQMANSFFPKWKSGDVYEIPKGVYHLSANIGIRIKITANVTGVVPFEKDSFSTATNLNAVDQ